MTTLFNRWLEFAREEFGNVPLEYELCGSCRGRGTMTLKRLAVSPEMFDEDPDFAEDYWNGMYDEPCDECNGRTSVLTLAKHAPAEMTESLERWYWMEAEDRAVRRAESGYAW
jgi:hypothetical protein